MPHSDAAAAQAFLPEPEEPDYVIAAGASQIEATPRTLKHDDTFAVFDAHGDAVPGLASNHGIFHRDTRHLSHFFLTIEGVRPLLLSSTVRDDNATLTCDLTNPDLPAGDGKDELLHDLVHIRRSRFLYRSACHECLSVHNFDMAPRRFEIAIGFDADFADLFEVRGATRTRRGTRHPPEVGRERVRLAYAGLDGHVRTTTLAFEPAPAALAGDQALYRVALAPGETFVMFVEICCDAARTGLGARLAFRAALRNAPGTCGRAQPGAPASLPQTLISTRA